MINLVSFTNYHYPEITLVMHVPNKVTALHARLWFTMTGWKVMAAARNTALSQKPRAAQKIKSQPFFKTWEERWADMFKTLTDDTPYAN